MKHILILFLAFALSGCGGRQFVPEWDTGYEVTKEADEINSDTAYWTGATVIPIAAGVLIPGSLVVAAALPYVTLAAVAASCSSYKCWKHVPYDDILMSGNALRGSVIEGGVFDDRNDPEQVHFLGDDGVSIVYTQYKAEHQAFQHPGKSTFIMYPYLSTWAGTEWNHVSLFQESLGLQRGDLVDVYYQHMPDLERKAIVDALIYPGVVVHIVCKHDDDDCFDKFQRDDDNFILGRWKTVDEFKAAFEETGGFPNP